jgi:hypothetical protein
VTENVLDVAAEEGRVGNAVETATARSIRADIWLRIGMVVVVCGIFIWLNWRVIEFVQEALRLDIARMNATPPLPPEHRLVTSQVVMALTFSAAPWRPAHKSRTRALFWVDTSLAIPELPVLEPARKLVSAGYSRGRDSFRA